MTDNIDDYRALWGWLDRMYAARDAYKATRTPETREQFEATVVAARLAGELTQHQLEVWLEKTPWPTSSNAPAAAGCPTRLT